MRRANAFGDKLGCPVLVAGDQYHQYEMLREAHFTRCRTTRFAPSAISSTCGHTVQHSHSFPDDAARSAHAQSRHGLPLVNHLRHAMRALIGNLHQRWHDALKVGHNFPGGYPHRSQTAADQSTGGCRCRSRAGRSRHLRPCLHALAVTRSYLPICINSTVKRRTRRRNDPDHVAVPVNPAVGDDDGRSSSLAHGGAWLDGEVPIRIVDLHLGNHDGGRRAIHQFDPNLVGRWQRDARDGQLRGWRRITPNPGRAACDTPSEDAPD